MPKLFREEQEVLNRVLNEWYISMRDFQEGAAKVFSAKGKMYDRESPVWERITFPHGFVQELRKKTDRLRQLLSIDDGESIQWDDVLEELKDIHNYTAMFGAIIHMVRRREDSDD